MGLEPNGHLRRPCSEWSWAGTYDDALCSFRNQSWSIDAREGGWILGICGEGFPKRNPKSSQAEVGDFQMQTTEWPVFHFDIAIFLNCLFNMELRKDYWWFLEIFQTSPDHSISFKRPILNTKNLQYTFMEWNLHPPIWKISKTLSDLVGVLCPYRYICDTTINPIVF